MYYHVYPGVQAADLSPLVIDFVLESTSGALPVLRVPPVPQVPSEAPSDETNSRVSYLF